MRWPQVPAWGWGRLPAVRMRGVQGMWQKARAAVTNVSHSSKLRPMECGYMGALPPPPPTPLIAPTRPPVGIQMPPLCFLRLASSTALVIAVVAAPQLLR